MSPSDSVELQAFNGYNSVTMLEVRCTKHKGRSLFTTCHVKSGQVVLKEAPLLLAATCEYQNAVCGWCLKMLAAQGTLSCTHCQHETPQHTLISWLPVNPRRMLLHRDPCQLQAWLGPGAHSPSAAPQDSGGARDASSRVSAARRARQRRPHAPGATPQQCARHWPQQQPYQAWTLSSTTCCASCCMPTP